MYPYSQPSSGAWNYGSAAPSQQYSSYAPAQPAPPIGGSYYGGMPAYPGLALPSAPHGAPAYAPTPPSSFSGWYASYYRSLSPAEVQELGRWFRAVDTDGNGHITEDELQRLSFGGVPLNAATASILVKVFDKDASGTIDFYEYAALHKFLTNMQQSFFFADRDRNGNLDQTEIHAALQRGGLQISFPATRALFLKFSGGRQMLPFAGFIHMCAVIALSKTKFESYQPMSGMIHLNFDQMLELVSSF